MLIVREVPRGDVALRSGLATTEITLAVVAAHVAAGGAPPTAAVLTLTALALFAAGLLVLHRRVPLLVAAGAVVALQVPLHLWLGGVGHGAGHMAPHEPTSASMVLAHGIAAAATATVWWLRRRAVDVVVAWASPHQPPAPLRAARVSAARPAVRPRGVLLRLAPVRGPPRVALARA